jgi:hypothetical protein
MNPYEANPEHIPPTDRYADVPLYGRYFPRPTDFTPDAKHINRTAPESLEYWSTVLEKCTKSNRIYENQDGGRDVFALGSVIIKSSHLKGTLQGRRSHRDYSYADTNEVEAIALARKVLDSSIVPRVYFAAKVLQNTLSSISLFDTLLRLRSTGERTRCIGTRENPRGRPQHSLAVHLTVSEGFLQATNTRDATAAAHNNSTSWD